MNDYIVAIIILILLVSTPFFIYKLRKIQNVKKDNTDDELKIILEDIGFKDEITRDGVDTKRHFNVEITNNGKQDIRWIRYEVVTTFHNVKLDKNYGSTIINGSSSGYSYNTKTETYRCYKNGFIHDKFILKNHSIKESMWLKFSGENHDECTGIEAYQIFGEFDNGDKFNKILNGKIEFNNKDFVTFTYVN